MKTTKNQNGASLKRVVMPRTWHEYKWPRFVPVRVRDEIERFWSESYGRSPEAWHSGTVLDPYNKQPRIGEKVTAILSLYPGKRKRTGRWVPAWNGIGRLISRGEVSVVCTVDIVKRHNEKLTDAAVSDAGKHK